MFARVQNGSASPEISQIHSRSFDFGFTKFTKIFFGDILMEENVPLNRLFSGLTGRCGQELAAREFF